MPKNTNRKNPKTIEQSNNKLQIMNAFIKFNKGLMQMPAGWRPWLGFLVTANLLVPLFFIDRPEAQLAVAAVFASMMLMTLITGLTGFTRLLGLGHVFWIPLLYFLWTRLPEIPVDSFYGVWIRVLMVANAISLAIDTADVFRYLAGDRAETISVS